MRTIKNTMPHVKASVSDFLPRKLSKISIYFVITRCEPYPLANVWTTDITVAKRLAQDFGGIITNEYWLRYKGRQIGVAFRFCVEKGSRRWFIDYSKPEAVVVDGLVYER